MSALKQRGLLNDTLVIWGAEFGRTPFLQGKIEETKQWGRDHHPYTFTLWMAGGGVKAGREIGNGIRHLTPALSPIEAEREKIFATPAPFCRN